MEVPVTVCSASRAPALQAKETKAQAEGASVSWADAAQEGRVSAILKNLASRVSEELVDTPQWRGFYDCALWLLRSPDIVAEH